MLRLRLQRFCPKRSTAWFDYAHQYMSQVVENGDTQIRDAILGNVGSMFVSRIGPEDSDTFERFSPRVYSTDLINSDKFTWYVKMIVDNSSVSPLRCTDRCLSRSFLMWRQKSVNYHAYDLDDRARKWPPTLRHAQKLLSMHRFRPLKVLDHRRTYASSDRRGG